MIWDRIPVVEDPSLALNVVVREFDVIRVSPATMKQLVLNKDMRDCAMHAAQEFGVHNIVPMRRVPDHHVGAMFRKSQTLLNKAANGQSSLGMEKSLRREIADLRALLDEAEMALDTCETVRASEKRVGWSTDHSEVFGSRAS